MKKRIKNYFKLGILLFGISIAITSCQKDDELEAVEESIIQVAPQLKATVANFETQLKGNTSAKSKLSKFNGSKALTRTIHSDTYNFSIDTTRVQKIETQFYTSFTFIVERDQINLDVVENYVLTQYNNDTFSQFLIFYPIVNGEPDVLTGSLNIINDDSLLYIKDVQCESIFKYTEPVCVEMPCQDIYGAAHTFSQGADCDLWGGIYMATRNCTQGGWVDISSCSSSGGSGTGTTTDSDPEGGPSGVGEETVIVPIVPAWQQVVNIINGPTLIGVIDTTTLSDSMIAWLSTTGYKQANLMLALLNSNYSSQAFIIQAIDALMNGTAQTFEQCVKWFGKDIEGQDFFYDATFWEDPSLTFPQQDLPTWDDYNANYPREITVTDDLYNAIGGDVLQARVTYPLSTGDTCALRVSVALNGAGITIPQINWASSSSPGTIMGADGKYYFLNAKALNIWMRKTFGTDPATATTPLNSNHKHYTAAQAGINGADFLASPSMQNTKGIYSMVLLQPNSAGNASGHADIFKNKDPYIKFALQYEIDCIDIWILN